MFNSTITSGLDLAPVAASISRAFRVSETEIWLFCSSLCDKKRSLNLQQYITIRFKIFPAKLLCAYDPKNITLYLYLLSAGGKKQPLRFSATLIFHQQKIFMSCRKIYLLLNIIATHVGGQNKAKNKMKFKTKTKTNSRKHERKGVFHHTSTKWRPRENPVWLNTINSENPDQSCSTRGTIRLLLLFILAECLGS